MYVEYKINLYLHISIYIIILMSITKWNAWKSKRIWTFSCLLDQVAANSGCYYPYPNNPSAHLKLWSLFIWLILQINLKSMLCSLTTPRKHMSSDYVSFIQRGWNLLKSFAECSSNMVKVVYIETRSTSKYTVLKMAEFISAMKCIQVECLLQTKVNIVAVDRMICANQIHLIKLHANELDITMVQQF